MPFLLRTSDDFIIVDEKPRQGIFYQIYNKEGFLRPALIHTGSCLAYSATLDDHNGLHVVVLNTNQQTTYYRILDSSSTKRVILEDTRGLYHFNHLSIQLLNNHTHLFYTVIQPNGQARSLVHQLIDDISPKAENLVTNLPLDCQVSYYLLDDALYILYPTYQDGYQLNCLIFTDNSYESKTLIRSDIPIIEWNICLHNGLLYILFTKDTYGHSNFYLTDTQSLKEVRVPLPEHASTPTLLSYLDCLWIHYKEQDKLYTLFCMPEQDTFSIPVVSSISHPVSIYDYYSLDHKSFNASSIYASLINTLRLATLSSIDIKEIHPDLQTNIELALLLEGLSLRTSPSLSPQVQPPIPSPITHEPAPTPKTSATLEPITFDAPMSFERKPDPKIDIQQAAQAFISEGNHFEI